MCDDLNRKFKRRTRVGGLFPNKRSVLRLVTVIEMETSEEWETGKTYRNLTPQNSITNTHNQQQPVA
jgi:transposase-like protein